jgi:hypothetical protein
MTVNQRRIGNPSDRMPVVDREEAINSILKAVSQPSGVNLIYARRAARASPKGPRD